MYIYIYIYIHIQYSSDQMKILNDQIAQTTARVVSVHTAIGYGLFTELPRIIASRDFSPSLFKFKRGILPLLTK